VGDIRNFGVLCGCGGCGGFLWDIGSVDGCGVSAW